MSSFGAGLVELRRVERNAERRADVLRRELAVERDAPRHRRRPAEAAAGKEAAEPADDVTERDAGREDVGDRPDRHAVAPQVPQGDGDGGDEAAVEHAGRAEQVDDLRPVPPELVALDDEQHQLGADEGADDDPDAEVHHPVGVETARRAPASGRTAAPADRRLPAAARRCRRGTRRSQTGWDTWLRPRPIISRRTRTAPIVMAASATLKAQKCAVPQ